MFALPNNAVNNTNYGINNNNNSFSKSYNEAMDEESHMNLLVPSPLKMNNIFTTNNNPDLALEINSKDKKSFSTYSGRMHGRNSPNFPARDKSPADVSPNIYEPYLFDEPGKEKTQRKLDEVQSIQETPKAKSTRRVSTSSKKLKASGKKPPSEIQKTAKKNQSKTHRRKIDDTTSKPLVKEEGIKSHRMPRPTPNSTKIETLVRRAAEKLLFKKPRRSIRFLDQTQEEIINDKASFEKRKLVLSNSEEKKRPRSARKPSLLGFLDESIPVLDPLGGSKICWNMLICLLTLWNFFAIPLQISFSFNIFYVILPRESRLVINIIACLQLIIFYLDVIVSMNTACFEGGHIVFTRGKILKIYFSKYFLFDLVTLMPLTLQTFFLLFRTSQEENFFLLIAHIVFYIRFKKLEYYWQIILEYHQFGAHSENRISLLVLFLKLLFLTHLLACIWHLVGKHSVYERTWISNIRTEDLDWGSLYFRSLYWSVSCLFTAGFNTKLEIENNGEVIIGIFMMFLGGFNISYVLFSVGSIFKTMTKHSLSAKNDFQLLKRYMRRENFDIEMQLKVQEYLKNVWKKEDKERLDRIFGMVQTLSPSLRDEFMMRTNGKIIANYPILYENFSKSFIKKLVFHLHKRTVFPEECVYQQGEPEFIIYFLEKGKIELSFSKEIGAHYNQVAVLKPGQYFGEIGFFTNQRRTFSARSIEFSTLYYIKQEDFLRVIADFSLDYQKFCYLRDQLILYDEVSILRKDCCACDSMNHLVTNCPLVHYVPDKDFILRKINYSRVQGRHRKERKRNKSRHAYMHLAALLDTFERHFDRASVYFEQVEEDKTVYEEEEDDEEEEEQFEDVESNAYGSLLPAPHNNTQKTNQSHTSFSQTFKTNNSMKELNISNPRLSEFKKDPAGVSPLEKRHAEQMPEKRLRKHSFESALQKSKTGETGALERDVFDAVKQKEMPKNISPSLFELVNNEDPEEFEEKFNRTIEKRDNQGIEEEFSEINNTELQKNHERSLMEKSLYSKSGFSGEVKSLGSSGKQRTIGSGQTINKKKSLGSANSGSSPKEKEHLHMFYPRFEKMMNFPNYSPHNNCENVILKCQKNFEKRTKLMRQSSHSNRNFKQSKEGESAGHSSKVPKSNFASQRKKSLTSNNNNL